MGLLTMRSGSTIRVAAKRMLKYYGFSHSSTAHLVEDGGDLGGLQSGKEGRAGQAQQATGCKSDSIKVRRVGLLCQGLPTQHRPRTQLQLKSLSDCSQQPTC